MESKEIPIANPAALLKEGIDNWGVLVNLDTGGSIALNPTGISIWKAVDSQRNLKEIINTIRDQFPDAPESMEGDVREIVEVLEEDGFVGKMVPEGTSTV